MISLHKINKSFNKKNNLKIIENLNIDFEPSLINIIKGPNGSGKSTLLKIIAGHLNQDSGLITYFKNSYNTNIVTYINNNERSFFWRLSVKRNLEYFLALDDVADRKELDFLLDAFDIKNIQDELFMKLSSGQKQKINIIRGILLNKKIILLDEADNNLDNCSKKIFTDIIEGLIKDTKKVVIYVNHNLPNFNNNKFKIIESSKFINTE